VLSTAVRQIAVFLLDDHEVVRRGVGDLLEAEPDIRVVGEAGTASSALARIPALRPDVAVLDVRLPDGDGVTVCPQERRILELIGDGLTNREIGERMFLAEKSVKNYVSALFGKLGMERRTQAAAYAARVFGGQHDGANHGGGPRALGTLFPLRTFVSGASCLIWTSTALFWNTCRGVSACA
jgi:DNA-binding NarL/FixJ family response regulator